MSLLKLLGEVFGISQKCPIIEEDSCAICLEPISDGGRIDCCRHTFCLQCIKDWSKKSNQCPQCRQEFRRITACKVFKDDEELQKSYSLDHKSIQKSIPSRRVTASTGSIPSRGSGLLFSSGEGTPPPLSPITSRSSPLNHRI